MNKDISKYAKYENKEKTDREVENQELINSNEDLDESLKSRQMKNEDNNIKEVDSIKEDNTAQAENQAEDQAEEEKIARDRRTSIFRLLAGVYLAYLSYSGITEVIQDTSNAPWYFYLIYILFGLIGIVLIIDGVRKQIKTKK